MRRVAVLAVALLGTVLIGAPAYAQETDTLQVSYTDTTALPEVRVSVVAPQALAGTTLTDDSFGIVEGGMPRAVHAQRLTGGEQDIMLAVDVFGGMSGLALNDVKRAASDFVTQAPKGAHIGIIAISSQPQVVSELTTNTADLLQRVAGLRAGGNTAIADSLIQASDLLAKGAAPTNSLVLLTDGADNSSAHHLGEVPAVLNRDHVILYTVQMQTSESWPQPPTPRASPPSTSRWPATSATASC